MSETEERKVLNYSLKTIESIKAIFSKRNSYLKRFTSKKLSNEDTKAITDKLIENRVGIVKRIFTPRKWGARFTQKLYRRGIVC